MPFTRRIFNRYSDHGTGKHCLCPAILHLDGIPNTFLFALGLVSFKWALNKPLKLFWRPEDLTLDRTADPRVDMAAAAHITSWTEPLDQTGYTQAISRLLHCNFDVEDGLLGAAEVRRAVFWGVGVGTSVAHVGGYETDTAGGKVALLTRCRTRSWVRLGSSEDRSKARMEYFILFLCSKDCLALMAIGSIEGNMVSSGG